MCFIYSYDAFVGLWPPVTFLMTNGSGQFEFIGQKCSVMSTFGLRLNYTLLEAFTVS